MCTVLLSLGVDPIAANKYIISYITSHHTISHHIISYIISNHITSRITSYHITLVDTKSAAYIEKSAISVKMAKRLRPKYVGEIIRK